MSVSILFQNQNHPQGEHEEKISRFWYELKSPLESTVFLLTLAVSGLIPSRGGLGVAFFATELVPVWS